VSQGRKIHFYQRGNWFLPPWSFTANADQSNGSITCAHVAGTKVLRMSQGWKIHFYQMWKLIFTTLEFYRECQPIKGECYCHCGNCFYYHRRHNKCLNSLLWSPSMVNHPIIELIAGYLTLRIRLKIFLMACQPSQPSSNNFSKPPIILKRRLNIKFSPLNFIQ